MTDKEPQNLMDAEPGNPFVAETPITPQDAQFRYYASQQFAIIEMLSIVNDDLFSDEVRETVKERILKAMSSIAQMHNNLPPEHQAETKVLMEIINSEIVFIGTGQQQSKERIMNLLN